MSVLIMTGFVYKTRLLCEFASLLLELHWNSLKCRDLLQISKILPTILVAVMATGIDIDRVVDNVAAFLEFTRFMLQDDT